MGGSLIFPNATNKLLVIKLFDPMTLTQYHRYAEMMFARDDSSNQSSDKTEPETQTGLPERLMLWVDRVGGFLVCLNEEVQLGAVTGEKEEADISLMANMSRQHATISRTGETYSVSAQAPTLLGDRPVEKESYLSGGSAIWMSGVGFRFRQPTVLSASAVLDPLSSHRIQGGAQGIVLMDNLCLLGPAADHHIICRHWVDPIILFRRGDELFCKSPGPLFVEEELVKEEAVVSHGQIVTGSEARFRIEFC